MERNEAFQAEGSFRLCPTLLPSAVAGIPVCQPFLHLSPWVSEQQGMGPGELPYARLCPEHTQSCWSQPPRQRGAGADGHPGCKHWSRWALPLPARLSALNRLQTGKSECLPTSPRWALGYGLYLWTPLSMNRDRVYTVRSRERLCISAYMCTHQLCILEFKFYANMRQCWSQCLLTWPFQSKDQKDEELACAWLTRHHASGYGRQVTGPQGRCRTKLLTAPIPASNEPQMRSLKYSAPGMQAVMSSRPPLQE